MIEQNVIKQIYHEKYLKNQSLYGNPQLISEMCEDNDWDINVIKIKESQLILAPFMKSNIPFLKVARHPYLFTRIQPVIVNTDEFEDLSKIKTNQLEEFHYLNQIWQLPSTSGITELDYNYLKTNFIINYDGSFDEYRETLSKSLGSSINRFENSGFIIEQSRELSTFVNLLLRHMHQKDIHISEFRIINYLKLLIKLNRGQINFAKNKEGAIVGGIFTAEDFQRVYYLYSFFDRQSRSEGIMTNLILKSVKESINQNKIFDFEGSDISTIAYFFKKFNPNPEYFIGLNKDMYSKKIFAKLRKFF